MTSCPEIEPLSRAIPGSSASRVVRDICAVTARPVHSSRLRRRHSLEGPRVCGSVTARGWYVTGGTSCPDSRDIPERPRRLRAQGWYVTSGRAAASCATGFQRVVAHAIAPVAGARPLEPLRGPAAVVVDRGHSGAGAGILRSTSSASSPPKRADETSIDMWRTGSAAAHAEGASTDNLAAELSRRWITIPPCYAAAKTPQWITIPPRGGLLHGRRRRARRDRAGWWCASCRGAGPTPGRRR